MKNFIMQVGGMVEAVVFAHPTVILGTISTVLLIGADVLSFYFPRHLLFAKVSFNR